VGSGQGELAYDIRQRFPKVGIAGIDRSQMGIEISRKKVTDGFFIQQDLMQPQEPLPAYRQWATHAVCCEVLEHVDSPVRIIENIKPYLASGCRLILTVPGGPMNHYEKHIGHRKHFSLAEVRSLLEGSGFRVTRLWGAGFPFFNLYKLLSLARGKAIMKSVPSPTGELRFPTRQIMLLFSWLFRFNRDDSRLGWQRVAVAQFGDGGSVGPGAPPRREGQALG
jgi:SAM-dependent methyltransferase